MAMSLAIGLRILFCVLGCVMLATLIYTLSVDGFPFRKDLLTPWMLATLIDFYINVLVLGTEILQRYAKHWIKVFTSDMDIGLDEGNISRCIAIVFLGENGNKLGIMFKLPVVPIGITTCFYIVLQFLKLSIHDALEDPIHYVLLRYPTKDGVEDKRRFSVVTAKIFFSALGCLMLATLVYTLLTDGSPFCGELFTP
ncbi:hypothetical protein RHMOL_Rhmol06G0129500 [Rhododendron molle]|uniref:Uncharacterized protein n=1 Tax=Rhododendron molle TaxID=49168 RepID=A0ACC0ND35_RHOML|nr:hypothetical protein RHMOL_Rhmol06G0129500 [Rhododendron molle]